MLMLACDSALPIIHASSGNDSIVITQAASYTYNITGHCVITPVTAGGSSLSFRLRSATGATEWLKQSGSVYLAAGTWYGEDGLEYEGNYAQHLPVSFAPIACDWAMTLTPR